MNRPDYTIENLLLDDSFVSYCLDRGTGATYSHWENIMQDNPLQKEIFLEAQKLIITLHGGISRDEIGQQIAKVRQSLQVRSQSEKEVIEEVDSSSAKVYGLTREEKTVSPRIKRFVTYAAAACILLLVTFQFFNSDNPSSMAEQQYATRTLSSLLGERKSFNMPDGSVVILNSNSSISYNGDFNKNTREIKLTGDAFFKVAKNPGKPFIVTSGSISTTAIGTEFFVKSHQREHLGITVDLLEGKVKVASLENSAGSEPVILVAGEKANYNTGLKIHKEKFDTAWMRNWISGKIVFNKTPVTSALLELEKWYDIDILVNNEGLEKKTITGEYNQSTLQDVLKVICFSIDRTFTVSENKITIH